MDKEYELAVKRLELETQKNALLESIDIELNGTEDKKPLAERIADAIRPYIR